MDCDICELFLVPRTDHPSALYETKLEKGQTCTRFTTCRFPKNLVTKQQTKVGALMKLWLHPVYIVETLVTSVQ